MDKDLIRIGALTELARRDLFYYCQLQDPKFYANDRPHLKMMCREIQAFWHSSDDILIIDVPPRHGKSYTLGYAVEWFFGKDNTMHIITGSYNKLLSTTFSKKVRDDIQAPKRDPLIPVFSDVFPGVKIKRGDAAANLWALEGSYDSYLATSPDGSSTGFGASLMVIDDIIKNAEEALNELTKDKHWDWFRNTMQSRLEEGGKTIVVMTRWASDDLVGRILEEFKGQKIRHINLKALQDDGTMLCPSIMSRETFDKKSAMLDKDIFYANYQQEPLDSKGRLYQSFKTYDHLPTDDDGNSLLEGIYSYTDTADEGDDYLCSIIFGLYRHEAYILDVYYTQDGMEITEPETARRHTEYHVARARIESNNGGSGFARNVIRELEELKNYFTEITWFHQSKNKRARILSNATFVMNHMYFPRNWADKWPEYFIAMSKYLRDGENKHDDAPDATTGVAETMLLID